MARRSLTATEHEEQVALFQWAELTKILIPELGLLYANANAGGYRGGYKANAARVANMVREGVKKGVPDIFLPVARGPYHGLYIELKSATGKPSKEQVWWNKMLNTQGYYARICRGWTYARDVILAYLETGKVSRGSK